MNFFKALYYEFRRKEHLRVLKKAKGLLRFSPFDSSLKTPYVCVSIAQAKRKFFDFSYNAEIWSVLIEEIHLKGFKSVYCIYDDLRSKLEKAGFDIKSERIWIFENEKTDEFKNRHYFCELCSQKMRHFFLDFLIEEVEKGNYDKLDSCKIKAYDFSQLLIPEVRSLIVK